MTLKMKKMLAAGFCCILLLSGCSTKKKVVYMELTAPEERGLNLVKITDESSGNVIGGTSYYMGSNDRTYAQKRVSGFCNDANYTWTTYPNLAISPDGTKIAYVQRANGSNNVMVKNSSGLGTVTQRTFRNVLGGFCWGDDGKLYFADNNRPNYYICSIPADNGTMMSQHTTGNVDDSFPVISPDGNKLYFTRWQSNYGPSIWVLDMETGQLGSCAQGYNACPIPGEENTFYCVRNSSQGRSEIWKVNYANGNESLVLSNVNHGFTNPVLSPDGRWLLVQGNAKSGISNEQNLDIFAVRTDGSNLTQLTYHPGEDMCPQWAPDGKRVYFISSRGNKEGWYNVWSMNFMLH
ncbi:MAG: hypothetical protein K2K79_01290 [Paramuribaculum sp.]|nr:hypothetical protein [Paramuribaculum sp.]